MLSFDGGDSTVQTVECHSSSVFLALFDGNGISQTRIEACFVGV